MRPSDRRICMRHAWLAVLLSTAVPLWGCPDVVHESDDEHDGQTRLAFDPSTVATVTGRIVSIEDHQHISRSHSGVRVRLHTEDEDFYVYLAPQDYFADVQLSLQLGEVMEVRGSVLEGDGHRVIIAQSVTVGHAMYPLRDDEGKPKWREWRSARDWK